MCDISLIKEVENGDERDLKTLRLAFGQLMRTVNAIRDRMQEVSDHMQKLPTLAQVNEVVETGLSIHIKTCDAARDDKEEKEKEHDKLKLLGGKFGLEAEGKPGRVVGLFVGLGLLVVSLLVVLVAKGHILDWLKSLATP